MEPSDASGSGSSGTEASDPDSCASVRIVEAGIVRRPVPLTRPLAGARGPVTSRAIRLLHLTAEDGSTGIGEASSVDWLSASAPVNLAPLFRTIVERVRIDRPTVSTLLRWSMDERQSSTARAGLQTALLDLDARRRGRSLSELLGGAAGAAPIPVSALVGDDEPAAMAREAAALARRGFGSFKVKVGRPRLDDDVARVFAVREAIGAEARLRLDANRAWNPGDAQAAIAGLAAAGVEMLEEPLRDVAGLAALGDAIPIAVDESVKDARDLARILAIGGARFLVLKLERTGGPLAALALAEAASRAGLGVVFTDSIESAVGRAATVHTAAAAATRSGHDAQAVGLGGLFLLDDATEPARSLTAIAKVEGPGLGLDVAAIVGGRPA